VKDYHINIFWSDEDEGTSPRSLTPGMLGICRTPAEALAEVERAKATWIEAAEAEGKPIPAPRYGHRATGPRRRPDFAGRDQP